MNGRFRASLAPLAALLLLPLLPGCDGSGGGNGTGPEPPGEPPVLTVGVARNDVSPEGRLEGFLVFFFDLDRRVLLEADATVNGAPVGTVIEPGIVDGPIYVAGAQIQPGQTYRLSATVQREGEVASVTSESVTPPPEFSIDAPATHATDQPMTVRWDAVAGATGMNVAAGSGFETDLPGSATSVTIPASAFAGLSPGETLEIEVTAYDVFYVSVAGGISGLQDAEEFAERFSGIDNIDGAGGAFGAATTVGAIVTLE